VPLPSGYNAHVADGSGETCIACGGAGWRIETRDGREVAVQCGCRSSRQREALVRAAGIPARYTHCTIDDFEIWEPGDPTLVQARRRTREFVDSWAKRPPERGLLFMGAVGCGKTHLAVAALHELVRVRGLRGVYANFIELVQALQLSFDGGGRSRDEIITPVVEADLLVLDELGAGKMTPWVQDLLYFVINSRYMTKRVTLCTTNFSDFTPSGDERLRTVETLADRIGAALRSRLHEMCDLVDIRCSDYRARSAPGRRRSG
jgi:DNA replication protein DnaC